ncbi:MAG TPA: HEPN domain-containing protein [Clostridia bacterium]|nr:HEPN domain-containing protein [Clostridia bacterium]
MADSTDYKKWLKRAEQDYKIAETIKEEGIEGLEDSFCYICHQTAEKLLKAFLLYNSDFVPKTHDLVFLLGKCKTYDATLEKFFDKINILNEYAVSARYPIDFDTLRTVEEAKEAFQIMSSLREEILRKLK